MSYCHRCGVEVPHTHFDSGTVYNQRMMNTASTMWDETEEVVGNELAKIYTTFQCK